MRMTRFFDPLVLFPVDFAKQQAYTQSVTFKAMDQTRQATNMKSDLKETYV